MRSPVLVLPFCLALVAAGCSNNSAPDMVTISGIVRNIDDGSFAEGVQVSLLDTEYRDDVATGSDGAYSLQVPKGSTLLLHTDDMAGTRADEWFPLINVDRVTPVVANEDIADFAIHSCPATSGAGPGSVAVWDNYLANADGANGDLYTTATAAASGGVVAGIFFESAAGTEQATGGYTVTVDSPDFLIGYVDITKIGDENTVAPDPAFGPDILFPGSTTVTDDAGWFLSFGEPGTAVRELTMTITDTDTGRNKNWGGMWTVPTRPGTISLVFPTVVDGAPASFPDFAHAVGWF